jgi:hypothetical protein
VLKVPEITDSMLPANAALEVTPSRLSKTIPLAAAAVANADSDNEAAAHVATNVRTRMRSPIERRRGVHYDTRDEESQGHGNVRLQGRAAEALREIGRRAARRT